MRHKYDTKSLVLARTPSGEASASVMLLTEDLGLVRARAQNIRASGAKLAGALVTLAESETVLVRGKEGWRVTGAVLDTRWAARLSHEARTRLSRVTGLLLRLSADEARDLTLFPLMIGFLAALATLPPEQHEAAETFAVLRVLGALGLEVGGAGDEEEFFTPAQLAEVTDNRAAYIARINAGIAASGL